jgi:aryl-alcohol dehydrogenase-like predicted oxidoreductase
MAERYPDGGAGTGRSSGRSPPRIADDVVPEGRTSITRLSPVGFGCYRVSAASAHGAALERALGLGCNLFDTASNYTGGKSEEALGSALRGYEGTRPFVITKAGYVEDADAELLPRSRHGTPTELVLAADDVRHCIHPQFLAAKLAQSTVRLGGPPDALLLHNPDHFLKQRGEVDGEELYRRIGEAFAFLEGEVERGAIRYYGVSANAMGCTERADQVDLGRLLTAAAGIAERHHFRILQFPFNFYESSAGAGGGNSLIATARRAGLTTVTNRPLNALTPAGPRRIATYEAFVGDDAEQPAVVISSLNDHLRARLGAELSPEEIERIPAVQFLSSAWRDCKDMEFAEYIFLHYIEPLADLFDGRSRRTFNALVKAARGAAFRQAVRRLNAEGMALREQLVAQEKLKPGDEVPLAAAACREYLSQGIDHVLVGMRQRRYVDDFRDFFTAEPRPLAKAV